MSPHNFKGQAPASPTVPDTAGMLADPFYVAVNEQDIVFLKGLQAPEEYGHALRLWWDPAPARGQKANAVTPTHVTIMAETPKFRAHVLALLTTDRAKRGQVSADANQMFKHLPVQEKPGVTPPTQGPWGRRPDEDDGLCAA